MAAVAIIATAVILLLLLIVGRLVTIIFYIGPTDFWCDSLGEHSFGWFIGYGLLGDVLGFFILCCGAGLIHECCCKEDCSDDW